MRANAEIVNLLLDSGAKADDANNEGVTPLLLASEKPHAAILQSLVKAGADVNARGKDRYTPLMRAVAAGADLDSVRVLLDGKSDVNAEDDQNRNAILLLASRQDADPEVLTALIKAGANPNAVDSSLVTPLMEACKQKNAAAVEVLLKAGAEVDLRDRNFWTALMHAASKGAPEKVYSLLKDAGADVDESTRQGTSALMIAIEAKVGTDGLGSLLRQGANPNHKTYDTISVLMSAVANANIDAVKMLLENGADPDQSTWDGLSPLMLAAQRTRNMKIFEIFAAAGANLDQPSVQGTTALMVAVTESNLPTVEKLVALGANVDAKDWEGFTPLIHAIQGGEEGHENLAIIDLLIASGCDVNTVDTGRATPLMHAALRGKLETTRRLLGVGASINAVDRVGWTALHFAARSSSGLDVLRLFLEKQNPDVPDSGGTTPLMVAASYNNEDSTRFLLSVGASPTRTDNTGRNAYEYATLKNASDTKKAIEEFRE
jgi:ankyrin repeat protein